MFSLLVIVPVNSPGVFRAEVMRLSTRTLTLRLPWVSMVGVKMAMPVWTGRPSLRECLKTCQKRDGWANLSDDQITTNLPNRPE